MTSQRTVTEMFDDISPRYDFLNHLLSMNIDRIWRHKASRMVAKSLNVNTSVEILDVATGTADLAIEMAEDLPSASITGIDLSQKMLDLGQGKVVEKGLEDRIHLEFDDAQSMSFDDESFDAVTAAFGVRNFADLDRGLREMARVLRKGGTMVILEFSTPSSFWIRGGYRIYSRHLLPWVGRKVSGHKTAYRYLPQSIEGFPLPEAFCRKMEEAGLKEVRAENLSGGIAVLYYGRK